MTFLSDLARLREAATKDWHYEKGTCRILGPLETHTDIHGAESEYRKTLARFDGKPINRNNAELAAYLVNHAEAIEGLVKAAEDFIKFKDGVSESKIEDALEKLNRSENET